MRATECRARQSDSCAEVQSTHPLRSIKFMSRKRDGRKPRQIGCDWDFSERLHRIGMKKHAAFSADGSEFRKRLDRASLIVGVHDRDERGVFLNQSSQKLRVHNATGINGQKGNLKTLKVLQVLRRVKHGMVLHSRNNYMLTVHCMCTGNSDQCQIARFCTSTRKNNLVSLCSKQACHAITRVIHSRSGTPTHSVDG